MLLGEDGVEILRSAHVAVFGVGGVGGFAVEALARAGIGELTLVDHDTVSESNLNRQIIALHDTVGMDKTEVFRERIAKISPECTVHCRKEFFLPEETERFDFSAFDYVVDAIDTVSGKIGLVMACRDAGTPIISAMGAGNKLDPTRFEVADIYETSVCPLARVMRRELKSRGVEKLKVVYSKEEAVNTGRTPGSVSFVPSVMGLIMAGEVMKDLIRLKSGKK